MALSALLLGVAGAIIAAEPLARPTGAPPGGFGLGTGPIRDEVTRIKLYEQTPGVVEGRARRREPAS
jgi:hypothetical protein